MTKNRPLNFSTKINLVKKRPILAQFGILFTVIPLIILLPISFIFSSLSDETPNVDYESVFINGSMTSGVITNIETQFNISINQQHPSILTFSYLVDGIKKESKVSTLEPAKVAALQVGDSVQVKYLESESIVVGFKPYSFPSSLFFLIPLPFLLIGIPFLVILFVQVSKELNLYKNGIIREGEIIAMTPNSGLPITNLGQSVTIHYQFTSSNGERIIEKSKTTDFSVLSDKKKGEKARILVSENDESKSCLYPEVVATENNWTN